MSSFDAIHDPSLDLVLEREVDAPPRLLWRAWTEPEHLKPWFCPKPWSVTECTIDLRPGGIFATTMRSPDGETFPNTGCWLEIVPERRLVFTDALLPGFRPAPEPFFTGIITFEPTARGTRYRAVALHRTPDGRAKHEAMGFHQGWNTALDQLVDYTRTMQETV